MKMNVKISLCLALLTPMHAVVNAYDGEDSKKLVVITLKGSPVSSSNIQNLKPSERISTMVNEFRLRAESIKRSKQRTLRWGASDVEPLYSSNSVLVNYLK